MTNEDILKKILSMCQAAQVPVVVSPERIIDKYGREHHGCYLHGRILLSPTLVSPTLKNYVLLHELSHHYNPNERNEFVIDQYIPVILHQHFTWWQRLSMASRLMKYAGNLTWGDFIFKK
jgi:hypothetical protein